VSGIVRGGFGQATIDKPPVRHEVLFCSDDAVLRKGFIDFLAGTLGDEKAAILVAADSHRRAVLHGLRDRGLDVDDALKRGALISLELTEPLSTVMLDGMPDPARLFDVASTLIDEAAKAQRGARVAVCRESPPALLAKGRLSEALRLEQLWGLIADSFVVEMLCAYALAGVESQKDIVQSICAEHTADYSQ
jgi:hypothetical protein